MHIFLSAIEGAREPKSDGGKFVADILVARGIRMRYNLVSYFALDKDEKRRAAAYRIRDNSEEMMVDSGAHSFQKGKTVSWDAYTDRYIEFIKDYDRPNVVGYFEMDHICTTLLRESQNLNLDIEVLSVSCFMSMAEHLYLSNGEAYLWRLAKYDGFGLPRNLMDYPYDWEVCDPRDYVWNESENYQEINDGDEVSL